MKVAIVVPVFNEQKQISDVLNDLSKINIPIYIVDDGSTDRTLSILEKYLSKNKRIFFLKHRVNLGKGAALKTGCEAAFKFGNDAVIIMDSDGQHHVKDIPEFVRVLETEKYDIVFGSRNLSFGVPLVRFLGNKFASLLISLLFKIYVTDLLCGFRAFTRKAYYKLNWKSSGYGVETEMVAKSGKYKLTSCEIPVQTIYYDRFKGVTILDAFNIFFDVFRWRIEL